MDLTTVATEAERLGPWAYLATLGTSGHPHVVPVHPAWQDGTAYVLTGATSAKARNVARSSAVSFHYTVSPETGFDHLIVDGMATVRTDAETKHRLWTGVFDYDLDDFGAVDDPGMAFLAITPARALILRNMGRDGREEWRATSPPAGQPGSVGMSVRSS